MLLNSKWGVKFWIASNRVIQYNGNITVSCEKWQQMVPHVYDSLLIVMAASNNGAALVWKRLVITVGPA